MSADNEQDFCSGQAGVSSPADDYGERHAAYKKALSNLLSRVPPGANVGPLIAGLRKEYQLDQFAEDDKSPVRQEQGNWSLADLAKRQKEREEKDKIEAAQKKSESQRKKQIANLKSRLTSLQFKKPADFSWPEETKAVLKPFETALDRQIWACFSLLKVQFREALANEFNLPGISLNLLNFSKEARYYLGGEKQLLADALSALKECLRILLSKPESTKKLEEKPEPSKKPVEKSVKPLVKEVKTVPEPAPKKKEEKIVFEKKQEKKPAELLGDKKPKEKIQPDVSAQPPLGKIQKQPEKKVRDHASPSAWFGFLWNNKFRRELGVKNPLATDRELEKAFSALDTLQQKAIVFRYRIARPAMELNDLIASGLRRGVEEFSKKAVEELKQKILTERKKEGVRISTKFVSPPQVQPEQKIATPKKEIPLPKTDLEKGPADKAEEALEKETLPLDQSQSLPKSDSAENLEKRQEPVLPESSAEKQPVFDPASLDLSLLSRMLLSSLKEKPLQDLFNEFTISERQLSKLILFLNLKQQEVLYWRFIRKAEWDEIARLMDTDRESTYGFFFRAMEKMAKELRKQEQGHGREEKDEWGRLIKELNLFDSEAVQKIAERIVPRVLFSLLSLDYETVMPNDFIRSLVLQPASEKSLNEYQARLFLSRCGRLTNTEAGKVLGKTLGQTAAMINYFLPKAKRFFRECHEFCFAELVLQMRALWDNRLISGLQKILGKKNIPVPVSPIQMAQAMRIFNLEERQIILLALVEKLGSKAIKERLGLKYEESYMPKKVAVLSDQLAENLQMINEKGISFLAEEAKFVPEIVLPAPKYLPNNFSAEDIPEAAEELAKSICNKKFFRQLFRFFREGIVYFSNFRQIAFCLRRLTEYERKTFFLRYKEGFDVYKIAEAIARSWGGIQTIERSAFKKIITDFTELLDSEDPMLGAGAEAQIQETVESVLSDNEEGEEQGLEASDDLLALATECWTDEFLVAISRHLEKNADLLFHPCQLAIALTGLSQSEKFVFQMSFGKERLPSKELAPRCHLKNSGVVQAIKRQAIQKIAKNIRCQGSYNSDWDKEPFYSAACLPGLPLEVAEDKEPKRQKWIKEVLEIDFFNAESIMASLEKISLERLNKDLGGNVAFGNREQLLDFLLLPPKYLLSFRRTYEGRAFLLSYGLPKIPASEIAKNLRVDLTSAYRYQWVCRQKIREFFNNLASGRNNRLQRRQTVKRKEKSFSVSDVARFTNLDFQNFLLGLVPEVLRRNMAGWLMEAIKGKNEIREEDQVAKEKGIDASKGKAIVINIPYKSPSKPARLLRSAAFREDLGITIGFGELGIALEQAQKEVMGREKVNVLLMRYCSNSQVRRTFSSIADEVGWTGKTVKIWIESVLAMIRQSQSKAEK